MFDLFASAANGFRTAIQLSARAMIGGMMVFFIGLTLSVGGRSDAIIPLGFGS